MLAGKSAPAASRSPRAAAASARFPRMPRLARAVADRAAPSSASSQLPSGTSPRATTRWPQPGLERRAPDLPVDDHRDVRAALQDVARLGEPALAVEGVAEDPRAGHDARRRAGLLGAIDALPRERHGGVELALAWTDHRLRRSARRAARSGRPRRRARWPARAASSAFSNSPSDRVARWPARRARTPRRSSRGPLQQRDGLLEGRDAVPHRPGEDLAHARPGPSAGPRSTGRRAPRRPRPSGRATA